MSEPGPGRAGEGGRARAAGGVEGSVDRLADALRGGLPRLVTRGALLDQGQALGERVLDRAVLAAEDLLVRDLLRGGAEDLADRCAAEVLGGDVLDLVGPECRLRGGEVAQLLEDGGLLLRRGQPGDELLGL